MSEKKQRLTLDDLVSLPNVQEEELFIPQWDKTILVRGISKATQVKLGRILNEEGTDAFDYQKALLKESVVELFINTLPETSYAKSLQRRTGNPGHGKNMLEAFRIKGFNLGRDVVKLEYSAEIAGIESEILSLSKEPELKTNK